MSEHEEPAGDRPAGEPAEQGEESPGARSAPTTGSGAAAPPAALTARVRSFVTDRPVAVLMLFLAAVVFGALSYRRLPVTLMPELSYPTLTVRTEYPGAAPEEVENDVSRRIEESLGVVGGLRKMSSISRAGVSDVVLEFSWDTDMSQAMQDTLERLDLVFLPDEAERPLILRFDPSLDPVLELSLAGDGERFEGDEGLRRLRRLAELQVKRALEPIKGVAAVRVRGGLEEEIHVLLDAEQLRRTGIPAQRVIERLGQENINVAGGTLKEGRTEFMVRTVNEYTGLEQIRKTIVARFDGRDVRIEDLGEVVRSNKEREILTRTDGAESVQLDVYKEADANMVALAKEVRARVGELDLEAERRREQGAESTEAGAGPGGRGRPNAGLRADAGGVASQLYRQEGAVLSVVADRSTFIAGSIRDVRDTAVLGGLLAVVVLFLFLRNLVSTLIVAVSIPISLLITFAPMGSLGVSLNIMSLGGLALGIGMLVDSSIVVLESIFRCRDEGDDLVASAVRGVGEVRSAVIASILTSIAVFIPMVFIEGIAGEAFGDLGLAVVISLLASMGVALLFIPMLASRRGWSAPSAAEARAGWRELAAWRVLRADLTSAKDWAQRGGGARGLRQAARALAVLFFVLRFALSTVLEVVGKLILALVLGISFLLGRFVWPALRFVFGWLTRGPLQVTSSLLEGLNRLYEPLLRRALAWPAPVLLVVVGTVAASWAMLRQLDTELLPEVRQGEITFEVTLPVGTPVEETERILRPVEDVLLDESESGAQIESVLVTYGFNPTTSQSSDEGEHTARFKLLLADATAEVEDRVVARLRSVFEELPDVESRVTRPVLFSFKTPIEVEIHGDELVQLRRTAADVEDLLGRLPELADVETTLVAGAPEVQIVYDRELLMRYGLDISQVAQLVRNQIKGFEATLYNLKDRRIPIFVRLEEADRRSTEDLETMVVNPGEDRPITLASVADVSLGEGPSEVRRVDSRRVALLRANLGDASLGAAVARIEEALGAYDWPSGTTFLVSGQSQEWERSRASLWLALGLSVFLVYVIMAAQFESLLHPLVIMFTIPLAFFGTVATLYLLEVNLSIVVFLGMIMLAGIVVNNAIVLVDYVNTLKARGLERVEAIVTAGLVRLRPILMTTATTVLGLLPMALGFGEGAEIRTPMALAVIGGLLASTALTLVVIPVIYSLVDGFQERLLSWGSSEQPQPDPGREGLPVPAAEQPEGSAS
ncbi:MAG TPA: efflux RND transporter permease subunit [Thermoanaerobaculia bacterium]|nr:efflux RND transporter permease subunit [Thermoanaerobaculia bacterium]